MKKTIRIGTRESKLALWQAQYIKSQIEKTNPDIRAEIISMKTTGDRILETPLEKIGGKGLFVKELDIALLEGRTDISVHSLKDMPMDIPEELPILAYSRREDPRDALILKKESEIPECIASSSQRRILQLAELYPLCSFTDIRGNVQTRLRKLHEGYCDGTVLAAAGLKRLGMEACISRLFGTREMIPAAGQGILAIQGRADEDYNYLMAIMDEDSRAAAVTERGFVRVLDGGCSSPVAAYASVDGNNITLSGLYYDEGTGRYIKGNLCGAREEAGIIGETLAMKLKERLAVRG